MPGLESNLTVALLILAVLGGIGWVGYQFRDPLFSRLIRYFKTWWERDKLAEAEERRQREARRRAEQEVHAAFNPAAEEPAVTAETSVPPATHNATATSAADEKCGTLSQAQEQQVVVRDK